MNLESFRFIKEQRSMDFAAAISGANNIQTLGNTLAAKSLDPDTRACTVATAEAILGRVAHAFAAPHDNVEVPAEFLQSVARLVILAPNLGLLAASFCKIVAACWTSPLLFSVYAAAVANGDGGCAIPKWWPRSGALPGLATPVPFWSSITCMGQIQCMGSPERTAPGTCSPLLWMADLSAAATDVLAASKAISDGTGKCPVARYRTLLQILLKGPPYHDLVMTIVFQVPGTFARIRTAASDLTGSPMTRKIAGLISDMFVHHAAWTAVCHQLLHLPDAGQVWKKYNTEQQDALLLALNNPFRLLADLLNQGCAMNLTRTSLLVLCINAAVIAVEHQSRSASGKSAMYSAFSECFQTRNLVATLCDIGYCISTNWLRWSGRDMLLLSPIAQIFPSSALPPIAKPDYFFVEAHFGDLDETVQMVQLVNTYNDLELAIALILKCILNVIHDEMQGAALIAPELPMSTKVMAATAEHIFACLVAANCCGMLQAQSLQKPAAPSSTTISDMSAIIIGEIIVFAKNDPSIWITLFNFANDVCYADMRLVPVFEGFFNLLVAHAGVGANEELVKCGILLFSITFCTQLSDHAAMAKYCDVSLPDLQMVEVSSSEYKFIYATQNVKPSAPEPDTRSTQGSCVSGASSRQKSYSKYGK